MNVAVLENQEAVKALVKAQGEMGKAVKNAINPHLKNRYADLGAVIDACFDALHANGFAVIQTCGGDDRGQYVETVFLHTSGTSFTSRVYLLIGKQDMQGLGSAITYARRYGLLGLAGLAPEDDDGEGQVAKGPTLETKVNRAINLAKALPDGPQKDKIREMMVKAKVDGKYQETAIDVVLSELEG